MPKKSDVTHAVKSSDIAGAARILLALFLVLGGLYLAFLSVPVIPHAETQMDAVSESRVEDIARSKLQDDGFTIPQDAISSVLPVPGNGTLYQVVYEWNLTDRSPLLSDSMETFGEIIGWTEQVTPYKLSAYVDMGKGDVVSLSRGAPSISEEIEPELETPYRPYGVAFILLGVLTFLSPWIIGFVKKLIKKG